MLLWILFHYLSLSKYLLRDLFDKPEAKSLAKVQDKSKQKGIDECCLWAVTKITKPKTSRYQMSAISVMQRLLDKAELKQRYSHWYSQKIKVCFDINLNVTDVDFSGLLIFNGIMQVLIRIFKMVETVVGLLKATFIWGNVIKLLKVLF